MGCVTWTNRFFPDGQISQAHFNDAYYNARMELSVIESSYRNVGWQEAIGSSGSIKSIANVLRERGEDQITPEGLKRLRKDAISAKRSNRLNFDGLKPERTSIFAGGLAILCALFDSLKITSMRFSDGALREGVLYDLVGRKSHENVQGKEPLQHCNTDTMST